MPIVATKEQKVNQLVEMFSQAKGVVLTSYRGLTVAQDTKLRRKLREAGVEYHVVKNTLTRIAAEKVGISGLESYLEGTTAIALSYTDPVAPAKILTDFIKELKGQNLEVKAGVLETKVIDADGVKALASLPAREVLIAQVLAGMQAPLTGLVNVLQGTTRNFVYVLEAIRKQKESA